jgi:hypothetical protein
MLTVIHQAVRQYVWWLAIPKRLSTSVNRIENLDSKEEERKEEKENLTL